MADAQRFGDPNVSPGAVLLGRFRVEQMLGAGGMGVVFAAEDLHVRRRVALKFLRRHDLLDSSTHQRFLREAQSIARLQSEHVARLYDVCVLESGMPFLVMELLEGETLGDALNRVGQLPAGAAVRCLLGVCEALIEAHRLGIVHRDIKPSNLFLARHDDGSITTKLLDFGAAKWTSADEPSLTQTDSFVGSPAYASPEQLTDPRGVDERVDVWGVGVTLYALLAGASPFHAPTVAQTHVRVLGEAARPLHRVRPDVDEALSQVIRRCLAKRREDRYETIRDVAQALARFAGEVTPHQWATRGGNEKASDASDTSVSFIRSADRLDADAPTLVASNAARPATKSAGRRHGLAAAVLLALLGCATASAAWLSRSRPTVSLPRQDSMAAEDAPSSPAILPASVATAPGPHASDPAPPQPSAPQRAAPTGRPSTVHTRATTSATPTRVVPVPPSSRDYP